MKKLMTILLVLFLAVSCENSSSDDDMGAPLTAAQVAAQNQSQSQVVNGQSVNTSTTAANQANDPKYDAPNQKIKDIEALVIARTNLMRGGSPSTDLKNDRILSYVARKWSKTMAAQGKLSHAGFPKDRMKWYSQEVNGSPKIVMTGENVAMSYIHPGMSAQQIANLFVKMWMDSPPHRANILGNWEFIGVGVYKDGNKYWATQIFAVKQ